MSKTTKIIFLLVVVVTVVLPFYYANAALVPCGLTQDDPSTPGDETHPCGFCDFFSLIDRVKNFLLVDVMIPVAVLFIVIGGIMILTAGAFPGNVARGKRWVTDTLIGVVVIFSAWMITNTIFQLFTGNNNVSQSWYKIECSVDSSGNGGVIIGTSKTPTPVPTVTTTSTGGTGTTFTCPNWKPLVNSYKGVGWERCVSSGGGTCADCVKVGSSSKSVAKSLGDFMNNTLLPQLRAKGISYTINDGMCPAFHHSSCAHFNGHAMDLGGIYDTAKQREVCKILNDNGYKGLSSCRAMTSATRGAYIMERPSNAGAPCPPPSSGCGNASFHIQN